MKKVPFAISFVTIYVIIYQAAPHIGIPMNVMMSMFVMSPFVVIYMAYTILKHGKPSGFTFDEKFYDDLDYRRNGKEQLDEPIGDDRL